MVAAEAALSSLLADEARPWGKMRAAYLLLQRVRGAVDKDLLVRQANEEWRRYNGFQGTEVMELPKDALESSAETVQQAVEEARDGLRTLHEGLRTLEADFGRVPPRPADAPEAAHVLCALPQGEADDESKGGGSGGGGALGEAPVAAMAWGEGKLLVLDTAASALRQASAARGPRALPMTRGSPW